MGESHLMQSMVLARIKAKGKLEHLGRKPDTEFESQLGALRLDHPFCFFTTERAVADGIAVDDE